MSSTGVVVVDDDVKSLVCDVYHDARRRRRHNATTRRARARTTTSAMNHVESHLSSLQRRVLAWDYFAIRGDEDDGEDDVTRDAAAAARRDASSSTAHHVRCVDVPLTFTSAREYVETYEPLLLEEAAAIVRRGEDDEKERRSRVAGVVEVSRAEEFHSAKFALVDTDASEFHDNDLVLLSRVCVDDANDAVAYEKAKEAHALGVVEGRDAKNVLIVRLHLPDASSAEARRDSAKRSKVNDGTATLGKHSEHDYKRFRAVRNALTAVKGERWYLKNLANLSTVTREWLAIHAFPALPYASTILKAKPTEAVETATSKNAWAMPDGLKREINRAYNDSQVKALSTALNRDPLVLIQGPPGTGKTRTILSLLSVLLHSTPSSSARTHVDFESYARMRAAATHLTRDERNKEWVRASPWLAGVPNPRDAPPLVAQQNHVKELHGAVRPSESITSARPALAQQAHLLGSDAYKRLKILVCAPSNSALDEIVLRIIQNGLIDGSGSTYSPTVVRVGVSVHRSVQSVSMEELVKQRVGEIGAHGDAVRKFEAAIERDRLKQAILEEATVVCSTLSFSGSGMFARMCKPFDAVIIDEAAQAVEPSTLVPLCYGAKQVFLVGDPRQLPATVLSSTAVDHKYDMSMFKRLQMCDYPVHMLKTQYRMHPAIRQFPSQTFYENELVDGPGMLKLTSRPWHRFRPFRPFVFFDVKGKEYETAGHSWANDDEAELAVCLIQQLFKHFPEIAEGENVAVISPYKAQVRNIRTKLESKLGAGASKMIDVNTIDGFQGREKEICIFSVVRAPHRRPGGRGIGGLGFVADERRINVGLTRARASLFVIGAAESIKSDENWGGLVDSAYKRRCAMEATKPFNTFFAKHMKEYDDGDLSGDEDEYIGYEIGEQPSLMVDDEDMDVAGETHHVHNPSWTGAAEFVQANNLSMATKDGFSKDGFRDELITEAPTKGGAGVVGGDDDMLGGVEDGNDEAADAFTQVDDATPTKKTSTRTRRAATTKA